MTGMVSGRCPVVHRETEVIAMRKTLAWTALFGVLAAPVAAQQHEHPAGQPPAQAPARGGMMAGGMMMGAGMVGMGPLTAQFGKYAPDALLAMNEHLSLTADQASKLAALAETAKQAGMAAHEPAMAAHMELRKLQAAEMPDTAAMRQYFMAHHTAEGNMQWIRASIAIRARALLTPTQRAHVEQMGGEGVKH
jgi:Spy/CpxP family protein refolding chaperone